MKDVLEPIINKSHKKNSKDYLEQVFARTMTINSSIIHLGRTIHYIRRFHGKEYLVKNDINREEYLKYHLSSYYIVLSSIYDQLLLLINDVYGLGLHERDCNDNTVVSNMNVKNPSLKKAMREFFKFLTVDTKIKEIRNLYVHRGIFNDETIEEITLYYDWKNNDVLGKLFTKYPQYYRQKKQEGLKKLNERINSIKTINEKIEKEFVADVLNSLSDTLIARLQDIESKYATTNE